MHDRKLTGKKKGRRLLWRSEVRRSDKSATERPGFTQGKKAKDTGPTMVNISGVRQANILKIKS